MSMVAIHADCYVTPPYMELHCLALSYFLFSYLGTCVLSLRLVGAVGAKNYVRSSFSQSAQHDYRT